MSGKIKIFINFKTNNNKVQRLSVTFNVQIGAGLDLIAGDGVLALVLEHRLLDSQLVDRVLLALVRQQLYLVLLAVEDLVSLEGPGGLLVGLAEGGGEHHLLVLDLLDRLVLQRNDPFVWFLKHNNRQHKIMKKVK